MKNLVERRPGRTRWQPRRWRNGDGPSTVCAGGVETLEGRLLLHAGHDHGPISFYGPLPAVTAAGAATAVVGRYVFYNNSAFDGNDPAANAADDAAVPPGKLPLLPGGTATIANYTSYSRGINGIIIDFAALPADVTPAPEHFAFKVGNDNTPEDWAAAKAAPAVTIRRGEGVADSDRVTLVWPDGAIRKTWLQVTVLDGTPLGLATPDVFYFGNAIGESGNNPADAVVNFADEIGARSHHRTLLNPAPLGYRWDFDRDRVVGPKDQLLVRRNRTTSSTALKLITVPADGSPPDTPEILEPSRDGLVISPADVHMVTTVFSDPDGDAHLNTDWQIMTAGGDVHWQALGVTGEPAIHAHFGDGQFVNTRAGFSELLPETDYVVRVRHRDDSGVAGADTTPWVSRPFRTSAIITPIPNAPDWTVVQPGFKVEALPVTFAPGQTEFRLPVNIAFVQNPGPNPGDPFFYVNELYGSIRVVTNDLTVRTYATGLLNYNPQGPISGSGENGLTGLLVEPTTGDLFVTMLYDDPTDSDTRTVPKVTRLHSTDGGLTMATATDLLIMRNEFQGQSHQVSNISIGPADGKLYVHNGDGISTPQTALNLNSFRGKILRMNLDGSAPSDNPLYDASNGVTATDHIFAYGFRNPFGGAWRDSDGQHYEAENGPSRDRLAKVRRGVSYGWNGSDASMSTNALYNWASAVAPVNIAFVQDSAFNGSSFPASKQGHLFVTESGPTYATGPQSRGKRITEFTLGDDPPDGNGTVFDGPRQLINYTGNGKATAAALAAGPDGLYFSDLYEDDPIDGAFNPTGPGANILRVKYVGVAAFTADVTQADDPPLTVRFTDQSDVPGASVWQWDFGDGTTSHDRNPVHTYTAAGAFNVTLRVTGDNGVAETRRDAYIRVGNVQIGTGLTGEYFDNVDFTAAVFSRVDPVVDFNFGSGAPRAGMGTGTFSIRWTGQVLAEFTERYTFHTVSDDGVRLYVDDQLLIDDFVVHGPTERTAPFDMVAGRRYDIRLEYFEQSGNAQVQLLWSGPSTSRRVIPQIRLFPESGSGLFAEYFHNADLTGPALRRVDPTVNFDYGEGSPDVSIEPDTFSARWTGKVEPRFSETYNFHTLTDDGVRLWVNDQPIIDNWTDHAQTEDTGTIALAAGQRYNLRMEFFENTGGAISTLSWSSPSQPKQIIPRIRLYPATLNVGLRMNLRFNEPDGTTALDDSGNNNAGNLTGGATRVPGRDGVGGAVAFDGVSARVTVANSASLNPTAGITLLAWVRPDTWDGGNRRILQKGGTDNQYRLLAEFGELKLHLAAVTGGTVTAPLPPAGAWHHVAGTYDGTTIRLIVDGVVVAQQGASGAIATTTDPLRIGAKTPTAPAGDFFIGVIDNVRVYDRALTSAEIDDVYRANH